MQPDELTVTLPALVTVYGVEIARAGEEWQTSTGPVTWTPAHLAGMVAAATDPALPRPVLKLGHTDPRTNGDTPLTYDATPALGRLVDVRLAEEGTAVVCDVAGVPAWLANIWPTAYPHRSVEVFRGDQLPYEGAQRHDQVIAALALLGETWPAIAVLDDIPALFGAGDPLVLARAPQPTEPPMPPPRVTPQVPPPPAVLAEVTLDDVRDAIYEHGTTWGWVITWRFDAAGQLEAIYEDGDGELWAVTFSATPDGVDLGDAYRVEMAFLPVADADDDAPFVAAAAAVRARAGTTIARFSPADPSAVRARGVAPGYSIALSASTPEETTMDLTALREQLGLPDDATDEQVIAAATERLAATTTEDAEPAEPDPAGTPAEDAAELVALRSTVSRLSAQETARAKREAAAARESVLASAVATGRITPHERTAVWEPFYDASPEKAATQLAGLPASRVPVTELGHGAGGDPTDADARYAAFAAANPV